MNNESIGNADWKNVPDELRIVQSEREREREREREKQRGAKEKKERENLRQSRRVVNGVGYER